MWKLKFYKAYVKDKRLKRMLVYWGRMKQCGHCCRTRHLLSEEE